MFDVWSGVGRGCTAASCRFFCGLCTSASGSVRRRLSPTSAAGCSYRGRWRFSMGAGLQPSGPADALCWRASRSAGCPTASRPGSSHAGSSCASTVSCIWGGRNAGATRGCPTAGDAAPCTAARRTRSSHASAGTKSAHAGRGSCSSASDAYAGCCAGTGHAAACRADTCACAATSNGHAGTGQPDAPYGRRHQRAATHSKRERCTGPDWLFGDLSKRTDRQVLAPA